MTARVELADLFSWQPQAPFDAVYDQACLCALPPSLWPDYVARLHTWLKPGGRLFILFMQTGKEGGPPFHCGMRTMRALFDPAHWAWPAALAPLVPHPSGVGTEQPVVLPRIDRATLSAGVAAAAPVRRTGGRFDLRGARHGPSRRRTGRLRQGARLRAV